MNHDQEPDAADDLRHWLGDDPGRSSPAPEDDRPRHRRTPPRAALALLVLAPWVLLGVLAITGGGGPPAPVPDAAGGTDGGAEDERSFPDDVDAPTTQPTEPGRTAPATPPAAAGPTAVRLVRDALTHTGARSTAVDAAAAEAPVALDTDTWVVRVHTVVLRGDRRRWRTATHEIWAVPVAVRDGGVVGRDEPWRVATVDDATAPVAWRPSDLGGRAVRDALRDAGIPGASTIRVQQHPTLDAVVRVTTAGRHVWMRTDPELGVIGRAPGGSGAAGESAAPDGSAP